MKRIRNIVIGIIFLWIGSIIGYQIGSNTSRNNSVIKCIKYKEKQIKSSIASNPKKLASSNKKNGVERFLKTGHLVPDEAHFNDSAKILECKRFHFKLSPPRSNGWTDGWIELKGNGKWYIKIF